MDYNAPLRWEHEDGRTGEEVSQVPSEGTVFFYDAHGPVGRLTDIVQARWWCMVKMLPRDPVEYALDWLAWAFGGNRPEPSPGIEYRFRVTRLEDAVGRFHYLLPGTAGVIDCNAGHPCKGFPCRVVDDLCETIVRTNR